MGKKKHAYSPSATTYEASLLGKVADDLLNDIKAIKGRYPKKADEGIETIHARKLLKMGKALIEITHKKILPKFSHQAIPNVFDMVSIINQIHNLGKLRSELHSRKYLLYLEVHDAIKQIIKASSKNNASSSNASLTGEIITWLSVNKTRVLRHAEKIPGPDVDTLLADLINQIADLDLDSMTGLRDDDVLNNLLETLQNQFFDGENAITEVRITHPISFELINAIIQRLVQAPDTVHELIPFFNPDSLPHHLNHDLVQKALNTFLGFTIELKNTKHPDPDQTSYVYSLELPGNNLTFDPQLFYEQLPGRMLSSIEQYFTDYGHTEHVINVRMSSTVLSALKTAELERMMTSVGAHMEAVDHSISLLDPRPEYQIGSLEDEIARRQNLGTENQALQSQLRESLRTYQESSVRELLIPYPGMTEGIAPDYGDFLLPEHIIAESAGSDSLGIQTLKIDLDRQTNAALVALTRLNQRNNDELCVLNERKLRAIDDWKNEQQRCCQDAMLHHFFELVKHRNTLISVDEARLGISRSTGRDSVELGTQINEINQFIDDLLPMPQILQDIMVTARQQSQVAEACIPLDHDGSLQTVLKHMTNPLNVEANILLQHSDNTLKALQRTLETIKARRQKALSDATFSDSMRSADPDALRQLLQEQTTQLAQLEAELQHLLKEQPELNTLLDSQQSQIEHLKSNKLTLDERFAETELKISTLQAEEQTIFSSLCSRATLKSLPYSADLSFQTIETLLPDSPPFPEKLVHMLEDIKGFLSEPSNIPFQRIDHHLEDTYALLGYNSFNRLLTLLEPNNDHDCSASSSDSCPISWTEFRTRQNSRFRTKPSPMEYEQALNHLMTRIHSKQGELETIISIRQTFDNLIVVRKTLEQEYVNHETCQQDILHNQKIYESILDQFNERAIQISEIDIRLKQLPLELAQMADNIKAMQQLLVLMGDIEGIRQENDQIEQNHQHFANDETLVSTFVELREKLQCMENQLGALSTTITQLSRTDVWQERINEIKTLLGLGREQLTHSINAKARLTSAALCEELDAIQASIRDAQINLTQINTPEPGQIQALFTRFQAIPEQLQHRATVIQHLDAYKQTLDNTCFDTELLVLQTRENGLRIMLAGLDAQLVNKRGMILGQLSELCQQQHTRLTQLIHHESVAEQQLVTTTLMDIRTRTGFFPDDDALDNLGEEFTATLKSLQQTTRNELARQEQINAAVLQRIQSRQTSISGFIANLADYQRTRRAQYHAKDRLFSADWRRREAYIAELSTELTRYADSGNSQALLAKISTGLRQFPGITLQAHLNKIASDVRDADRHIPTDYLIPPVIEPNTEELNHQLAQILFEPNSNQYTLEQLQKILALKLNIDLMRSNALQLNENPATRAIIINLANKLQNDLARFVVRHKNTLPSAEEFAHFKLTFTERLHSEDAILSHHDSSIKIIIANVLIGLLSLGLVLLGKAAHSKWKHGYTRLFFEKTQEQQQIETIKDELYELDVLATPA